MESHAQRLLEMVPSLAGDKQRHEMMRLAKEESDRAEAIKRQIRLLQGSPLKPDAPTPLSPPMGQCTMTSPSGLKEFRFLAASVRQWT